MKKFVVLVMLIGLGFSGGLLAKSPEFVVTSDGVQYFNKLKMTMSGQLIGRNEAGVVKYKKDDVMSFRLKGKIYEKVPLYKDKELTGDYVFMELCGYRNGLKVYKHKDFDAVGDEVNFAFVYKDKVYWLAVDKGNAESLSAFFGLNFRVV
jgi:hypothetical protein